MSVPRLPDSPVPRRLEQVARQRLQGYPALVITGPRQSGQTTLARMLAPDRP